MITAKPSMILDPFFTHDFIQSNRSSLFEALGVRLTTGRRIRSRDTNNPHILNVPTQRKYHEAHSDHTAKRRREDRKTERRTTPTRVHKRVINFTDIRTQSRSSLTWLIPTTCGRYLSHHCCIAQKTNFTALMVFSAAKTASSVSDF